MIRFLPHLILALLCSAFVARAELKVASMHPFVGDLARQIGGQHVEVVDLLANADNIHHFAPTPATLRDASDAQLVLASGKHMEQSWIDKLRDNLPATTQIIEVGRSIPSLLIDADDQHIACCPAHAHGTIDPHWWHDPRNMKRAARVVANAFAEADPEHRDDYQQSARNYRSELDQLHNWIKQRIAEIPRSKRNLATRHLAFAYLCKAYGLRAIPVLGLNADRDPTSAELMEILNELKNNNVHTVFPDVGVDSGPIARLLEDVGVKLGQPLMSDTFDANTTTYIDMMRRNINTIASALTAEP